MSFRAKRSNLKRLLRRPPCGITIYEKSAIVLNMIYWIISNALRPYSTGRVSSSQRRLSFVVHYNYQRGVSYEKHLYH